MPFCYVTRPLAGLTRFTGQPVVQGTRSSEEAIAALVEMTGLSQKQVETVIEALGQYSVQQTMQCWRIAPLLEWFGFQGTCGGSHDSPDFVGSLKSLSVDIRLGLGKKARAQMDASFQAENVGRHSLVAPEVVNVVNMLNGTTNTYAPGKPLQIELADGRGKLNPKQNLQGVFFVSSTGIRTRATEYAWVKGANIACNVPMGLTGEQTLSVSLIMNRALRTGIYNMPLHLNTSPATSEESPPPARPATRNGKGSGKGLELQG